MEHLLLILIGILCFIVFALSVKVYFLRKAAQEITNAFHEKLTADTNTLIDISSRDSYMRNLAAQINQELRLLHSERHRYQQGDLELKEAITNISHDLRTPLTAINGYLDLLDREEKNETIQHYLSQIKNRTAALKHLTEELFQYSIMTSSQNFTLERINLVQALEESLLSFYAIMQEKSILPQITLPKEPVWRKLDANAVNRIFSNVISNALKYSDGNFSVIMDTNGCITYSNTAHHLNPITVGRMFDRFYTVEANRNSTGLGLSIARILTEQMGGSIQARYQNDTLHIIITFRRCKE